MMRGSVRAMGASLLLAGCSLLPWPYPVPDEAVVNRLERQLENHSCIGQLSQWERHYFFPLDRDGGVDDADTGSIRFDFKQAGAYEFREGRKIETPSEAMSMLDHRQYRMAFGRYDVATGRLTVDHCGMNCDESVPAGADCG